MMRVFIAALILGVANGILVAIAIGAYIELPTSMNIAIWLPAGACGLGTFVIAAWRMCRGESSIDLWESAKEAWNDSDL